MPVTVYDFTPMELRELTPLEDAENALALCRRHRDKLLTESAHWQAQASIYHRELREERARSRVLEVALADALRQLDALKK